MNSDGKYCLFLFFKGYCYGTYEINIINVRDRLTILENMTDDRLETSHL